MSLSPQAPSSQAAPVPTPRQKSRSSMMDPIDWDAMNLCIARDYGEFKYSVYHYEVQPSAGYHYAQSWLEDLLATNLKPGQHKWHSHTSPGFIVDGTRLSVLVLHNAVNPFEWKDTADSSMTIGAYGIEHDSIYWKTIAPSIKWIIDFSTRPDIATLSLKHKWSSNELEAKRKRFHKAYWLAAARMPLRGMLNRPEAEAEVDTDPFVVSDQDYAYPYEFTKKDLTNVWGSASGWECNEDEAEAALENVREEMEGWDWGERGCVVTGSSEWE